MKTVSITVLDPSKQDAEQIYKIVTECDISSECLPGLLKIAWLSFMFSSASVLYNS